MPLVSWPRNQPAFAPSLALGGYIWHARPFEGESKCVRHSTLYGAPTHRNAASVSCKFNSPRSRIPESKISGAVKISPTLAKSGNEKIQDSNELVAQRGRN